MIRHDARERRSASSLLLGLVAGCSMAACVGTIGGDEELGEDAALLCEAGPTVGPSPMRRMTRFEYDNTVRDLFGDDTRPASQFPEEEEAMGFNNNASALVVTPLLAEMYMVAAEGVAARATEDVVARTGCSPDQADLDACVRTYLADLGKRAFRRPLANDELDAFMSLYAKGRSEPLRRGGVSALTSLREGVSLAIEAALQSPQFLYRVELSGADRGDDVPTERAQDSNVVPLTSWEMASRLSYLLWASMPDDELFAAAELDELRTKEQVEAQARRMLSSPKARAAVDMFHAQWLDYDRVLNAGKDVGTYPEWSADLAEDMRVEMETFIDRVIFYEGGDLETLLTADYSFASKRLAQFYGVEAKGSGEFSRVEFPADEHAGLLSMGAILAYYAHSNQTSPVHRGKLVREVFLCDLINPPPADVQFNIPEPSPDSTARERFAQHSADPACSGCHDLMDPLGFGFENFDGVGRYRTTENGAPIDASGVVTESDIDGSFVGVGELAAKLASSRETQDCYAKQWFRWGYGRVESDADACTMAQITDAFDAADGNVQALLVALTQTDAFMVRVASELERGAVR